MICTCGHEPDDHHAIPQLDHTWLIGLCQRCDCPGYQPEHAD